MVAELGIVARAGDTTTEWTLRKRSQTAPETSLGHPANGQQPAPAKAGAALVAAMENILAVYTRPHDPDRPLVCQDETSTQFVREAWKPVPTLWLRCTPTSFRRKCAVSWSDLSGGTRRNTAVGSIWRSPNLPCCHPNVRTGVSPAKTAFSMRSRRGRTIETSTMQKRTGSSGPTTPG